MIRMEKVDSLDVIRDEMVFDDLSNGDPFVFAIEKEELKVKTSSSYFYSFSSRCVVPQKDRTEIIIPVDAKMNWCLREER